VRKFEHVGPDKYWKLDVDQDLTKFEGAITGLTNLAELERDNISNLTQGCVHVNDTLRLIHTWMMKKEAELAELKARIAKLEKVDG